MRPPWLCHLAHFGGTKGSPSLGLSFCRDWKLCKGACAEPSSVLLLVMDVCGSELGQGALLITGLDFLHVGWTLLP